MIDRLAPYRHPSDDAVRHIRNALEQLPALKTNEATHIDYDLVELSLLLALRKLETKESRR